MGCGSSVDATAAASCAPPAPTCHGAAAAAAVAACPMSLVPAEVAGAILAQCGWAGRAACLTLNKHWAAGVFGSDLVWRTMCDMLHRDDFVYVPPVCYMTSWRTLFGALWPQRARWAAAPEADPSAGGSDQHICTTVTEFVRRQRAGETGLVCQPAWKQAKPANNFAIKVVSRLRPKRAAPAYDASRPAVEAAQVNLPLHQQIALLRKQKGLSKAEAFQHLFGAKKADFFADAFVPEGPPSAAIAAAEKKQAQKPSLAKADLAEATAGVVSFDSREVVVCASGVGMRTFKFDAVLGDNSTQAATYEECARRSVSDFLHGFNTTIFCFGQTASGKTHTLSGPDIEAGCSLTLSTQSGVLPRACAEVVAAVNRRRGLNASLELKLSFVEVYGDEVTDLLAEDGAQKSTGAWQGTAARAALDGNAARVVKNASDVEALLRQGDANKKRAVRVPATWTILQQDGPNHLGLWHNVLPGHQIALITSGCVPCRRR